MRISVLIPSRGRPNGLALTVMSMNGKASGEHDVRYVIGCDDDDPGTIEMAAALKLEGLPVIGRAAPRSPSLGGLVNQLALRAPADVYCSLSDDVEILTEGWDRVIADAWAAKPDGIWFWRSATNVLYAIVSEKWRAAAGRVFTDHFPFWYDDVALIETYGYARGKKGGDTLDCWLCDRAASTHRLRDLQFWDDFFWFLRDERRADARRIAEQLGWPRVEDLDPLDLERNPGFNPDGLMAKQGERQPPTPEYLAALARAKAMMQQKEAA